MPTSMLCHVLIPLACQGNELHLLLARYVFAQLWAPLSFKPTISSLPYWIPAYSAHGGECKVDVYLPSFTFVLPYLVFTRDINIRHSSVAPESGLTNLIIPLIPREKYVLAPLTCEV